LAGAFGVPLVNALKQVFGLQGRAAVWLTAAFFLWGATAVLWGRFEDDWGHRFAVRYVLVQEDITVSLV